MAPTAKTQCEVWGKPVHHSLSPVLHRAAYEVLGLPWTYTTREVGQDSCGQAFAEFGETLHGISLTMPLKEAILDVVAERDPIVDVLQAANTVYRRGASVVLSNTDAFGVQRALEHFGLAPRAAWILGAGATARAVGYGLMHRGTTEVVLMVRDLERAAPTVDALSALGLSVQARHLSDVSLHGAPDIVVSSVPGGAEGMPEFPPTVTGSAALFDVAYSPWPSQLATQWSGSTLPVISGLWMLAFQALAQLRVFVHSDVTRSLDQEDRVVTAMLRSVGLDPGSLSSAGMGQ